MASTLNYESQIDLLLQLSLGARPAEASVATLANAGREQWEKLLALSESHHVVLRAFDPLGHIAREEGYDELAEWCTETLAREKIRIATALGFLEDICVKLEGKGIQITVMKSLDHWPDIGNDLDLYTPIDQQRVSKAMLENFAAAPKGRTWGDRLARKNNFGIDGLRESVEIHHGVLGQTGEHTALARRFCERRVAQSVDGYTFMVPAPEEQIVAATLQRMYRHLYIRVCDIVNTHSILESGKLDYAELRYAADLGGIWAGVATYLRIVTEFVRRHRGTACQLPSEVMASARFGMEEVTVRGIWLRVPVRRAARLYGRQLCRMAGRRDLHGVFRLSLLPPLASAARLVYKLTGDHKGIW
ncbi:MAG: hypothetical protein JWM54_2139 [Acidobacteriaceae bacterium]|nr:hypothetical protein [Acidobacteriaceae bacterium]